MTVTEKACPMVLRKGPRGLEVLAFEHPLAGRQFVKGTIKPGEVPLLAALRELREESGIALRSMDALGTAQIDGQVWHLFCAVAVGLPDAWEYQTEEDEGHVFSFFWHPFDSPLDGHWHAQYRAVFRRLRSGYSD